jgi:hypothetical protein
MFCSWVVSVVNWGFDGLVNTYQQQARCLTVALLQVLLSLLVLRVEPVVLIGEFVLRRDMSERVNLQAMSIDLAWESQFVEHTTTRSV